MNLPAGALSQVAASSILDGSNGVRIGSDLPHLSGRIKPPPPLLNTAI
jgi:hypothetical protein